MHMYIIHTYICMYICVHACTLLHTYIHTYIYIHLVGGVGLKSEELITSVLSTIQSLLLHSNER